jgi:hypothetical protein
MKLRPNFVPDVGIINEQIQIKEFEICVSNDWNFNQGNGADILAMILQASNDTYDFT